MRLKTELINKLEEITLTKYNFNYLGETDDWDIIVEDLLNSYEDLLDEYNDYKMYVDDNYRLKNYNGNPDD